MSIQPGALDRFAGPRRRLPSHLTKHSDAVTICQNDLRTDRECYCTDCQCRVTLGSDWEREYGHAPDCEYSIRREDWHALDAWGDDDE